MGIARRDWLKSSLALGALSILPPTGVVLAASAPRIIQPPLKPPGLSSARKLVLFGDSFTSASDGVSGDNVLTGNDGYGTWLNILSGFRLNRVPNTNNYGVSGDTTTLMLARLGTVLATQPDIVVMPCGTNDIAGSVAYATITANLKAMFNALLGIGAIVIWPTILPRPGTPFTANQILAAQAINTYCKRFAEVTKGFYCVDLDPTMTDRTAASWTINSGYLRADGIHPSVTGSYYYAKAIFDQVISTLVPATRYPLQTVSDAWNATYNPAGNLLLNGMMIGTAGTVSGGVTGTAATSFTLDGTNLSGAAAVGSSSTMADGRTAQVVTVSGSKTGNSKNVEFFQYIAGANLSGMVAGDVIEGAADIEIGSHTNIRGAAVVLVTNEGGVTYVQYGGSVGADNIMSAGFSGRIMTPRRILTATPAYASLTVRTYFTDGSVSVAGAVKISSMAACKVLAI